MPLKLKKRGEIWHYSGTVAGHRLRGSCKTAQRGEAEKHANAVETKWLDRGRYGVEATLTFAQASAEYRKRGKVPRYLELVEDYWKDTLVKDITRGAMKRAAIALLPNGSGAYRNRAVIVPTQAVINHCAELELCAPLRASRFTEPKRTKEPATWPWVQAFMEHSSPHLAALACFMFMTGARISESISIHWRDIDFSGATVIIRMGKIGGAERVAHLPPELVAALANMPGDRPDGGKAFPYAGYGSVKDPWNAAVKRAGIKRLTPHCCRHGFATSMLHNGVDILTVADLGGWKSAAQLFKTYGHARTEKTLTNMLSGAPPAHGTSANNKTVVKHAVSK
jgi:integrase